MYNLVSIIPTPAFAAIPSHAIPTFFLAVQSMHDIHMTSSLASKIGKYRVPLLEIQIVIVGNQQRPLQI